MHGRPAAHRDPWTRRGLGGECSRRCNLGCEHGDPSVNYRSAS
ncbi:hypothetical protein GLA29479_2846 [Lysobacter antibioticus]|nr:hypothetical protein GLA29479_2846 [Lysobacter antibioticus]